MGNSRNIIGMSFLSWLGLLFIALKLTSVIAWSWWWVLSPFWIPWAIFIGILFCIGLVRFIAMIFAVILTGLGR